MKKAPFSRFLCLLLALLMLTACFGCAGCDRGGGEEDTTAETEPATEAPPRVLDLTDAAAKFVVVRPDEASDEVIEAAKKVRDRLKNSLGMTDVQLKSDFVTDTPGFREAEYEILIGDCDRESTRAAAQTLRYKDYVITVTGTKVVILGGSDSATSAAVSYFLTYLLGDGKLTEGELYRLSANYAVSSLTLNGVDISRYTLVYPSTAKNKYVGAVAAINDRLRALSGQTLKAVPSNGTPGEYEIQLGDCKRAPSAGKTVEDATAYLLTSDGKNVSIASVAGVPATNSAQAVADAYFPASATGTLNVTIPAGEYPGRQQIGTPLADGATLRVMSNNVLGDDTFPARAEILVRIYMKIFPDILGMQECNSVGHSKIITELSDYYASTCRTIGTTGRTCYTPILYRKDRFDLVESGSYLYDQRWPLTDTKTLSWAILLDKTTGRRLAVINTHAAIITGSYDTVKQFGRKYTDGVEGAQWREDNSRQILEQVAQIRAKYGENFPIFIMGDLNASSSAKSVSMLTKETGLTSCMSLASVSRTTGASFHTVGQAPKSNGSAIDHILTTSAAVSVFTHTINLNQEAYNSSDHCQVWVDVTLK